MRSYKTLINESMCWQQLWPFGGSLWIFVWSRIHLQSGTEVRGSFDARWGPR